MNINIHNNPGAQPQMVESSIQADSSKGVERAKALQGNDRGLVVSEGADTAPVEEIPDSALDRDDAIGRLVAAAFGFPAPPFPTGIS